MARGCCGGRGAARAQRQQAAVQNPEHPSHRCMGTEPGLRRQWGGRAQTRPPPAAKVTRGCGSRAGELQLRPGSATRQTLPAARQPTVPPPSSRRPQRMPNPHAAHRHAAIKRRAMSVYLVAAALHVWVLRKRVQSKGEGQAGCFVARHQEREQLRRVEREGRGKAMQLGALAPTQKDGAAGWLACAVAHRTGPDRLQCTPRTHTLTRTFTVLQQHQLCRRCVDPAF